MKQDYGQYRYTKKELLKYSLQSIMLRSRRLSFLSELVGYGGSGSHYRLFSEMEEETAYPGKKKAFELSV